MWGAFAEEGVLEWILDYPLGPLTGRRALGIRVVDTAVPTWDLARAIGADEHLDGRLVIWVDEHWDAIYAPVVRTPFFAGPVRGDPRLPPGRGPAPQRAEPLNSRIR